MMLLRSWLVLAALAIFFFTNAKFVILFRNTVIEMLISNLLNVLLLIAIPIPNIKNRSNFIDKAATSVKSLPIKLATQKQL
jgi:competence protein ComGC